MHHQTAMRVGHGVEHAQEQAQALFDRQPARVAPDAQRLAADQFHHHVRRAVFQRRGIQQARDARMVQRREHLAFEREAPQQGRVERLATQQLDRDFLFDQPIGAGRTEHPAHAAAADHLLQLVDACATAGRRP